MCEEKELFCGGGVLYAARMSVNHASALCRMSGASWMNVCVIGDMGMCLNVGTTHGSTATVKVTVKVTRFKVQTQCSPKNHTAQGLLAQHPANTKQHATV